MTNQATKMVFMGSPEVAARTLRELAKAGFEFDAVVTQTDKPQGRKKELTPTPVKIAATELNIPVFEPKNKLEVEEIVEKLCPDLVLVVAFGMILTKKAIEIPKFGIINTHFSLLPQYRGAAPYAAAILNGDKVTGTTIMQMSEGLDEGDVIEQKKYIMTGKETSHELLDKLTDLSIEALKETLPKWICGEAKGTPQQGEPTYFPSIKKEAGHIDFETQTAEQIERMSRALTPWPGVYTFFNNKKLDLYEISISDSNLKPGEIAEENEKIFFGTKQGAISPAYLKIEGKNKITAKEFIRGYPEFARSIL